MVQNLDLNKMGLIEMSSGELQKIEGGKVPSWLKRLGPVAVGAWVMENWRDIKSGAVSAWEDFHN